MEAAQEVQQRAQRLLRWTLLVLSTSTVATVVIVGREVLGMDQDGDDGVHLVYLALWLLSPYAALALAARWLAVSPLQRGLVLAGAVVAGVGGFGSYLDAFVLRPGFLNFLVLLAVPNLLWMAVLVTCIVAGGARWWQARQRHHD